jgi:hypothetical protein
LKTTVIFGALILLTLLLFSPLLHLYFPLGLISTRDSIAGWSYGLAQIAFGLAAAFVLFFLPQVVEINRLRWKWEQTLRYYKLTETLNRDAAFSDLIIALEAYTLSHLASCKLSKSVDRWIGEQKSRPSNQLMTCREIDESVKLLSHELRDLIESKEQWKLMVETTEGLIPNAGKFVEMRSLLFAEYSSRTLRKRLRIITGLLLLLIFMSLLFGSLALAPDPFWYVFLTEMFSGDVLRRSEPNYPEMSLWITACIYLGNVFFLTLWFGLETHSVHLHNTDSFDE